MEKSKILAVGFILGLFFSIADANPMPEDRCYPFKITEGMQLDSIFGDSLWVVSRINKLSPEFMLPGQTIQVPYDFEWAENWSPLSDFLLEYQTQEKLIYINLSEQWFGAYEYGQLIFSGPICSGRRAQDSKGRSKFPTPTGIFKIESKELKHFSKKFEVWMPYAMFFYRGMAIHTGVLPGRPASGGCVRLFSQDAEKLFNWAEIGTPVIITKTK